MIYLLLVIAVGVLFAQKSTLKKSLEVRNQQIASLDNERKEILQTVADLKIELEKYRPIIEIDRELKVRKEACNSLDQTLRKMREEKASLEAMIEVLVEKADMIEAGFYQSKYDFDNSEKYEAKLGEIRDQQKKLIREKTAIVCSTEWTVGNSRAEGKKMTDRTIKLGLSAFNVQCDNEILRVKFDNIDRATDKIHKIKDVVNKLLEPNHCQITTNFVDLKLQELYLAYEYQQKVQEEKEEQRAIREQMREEEKARREAERAEADAVREEKRYSDALEKAKKDLESKTEDELALYSAKIKELEYKLKEAQDNKERAKSMAELTRMGHVYIISNIGSFGEDIFKIGMTRRLDPMDRVDELGDASVPFDFDVHAMIKSDDAPNLEKRLHERFQHCRVNRVNARKEFFKVTLAEIEQHCKELHQGELKLTRIAEAKEFRQTLAVVSKEEKSA